MSNARKTQAKYGAKIPTAPSAGAKLAPKDKPAASADAPAKTSAKAKSGAGKKG